MSSTSESPEPAGTGRNKNNGRSRGRTSPRNAPAKQAAKPRVRVRPSRAAAAIAKPPAEDQSPLAAVFRAQVTGVTMTKPEALRFLRTVALLLPLEKGLECEFEITEKSAAA